MSNSSLTFSSLSVPSRGHPPAHSAAKVKPEEPPTRASKLEFKTVNEVFAFRGMQPNLTHGREEQWNGTIRGEGGLHLGDSETIFIGTPRLWSVKPARF
jgi:hypothetical protein